MANHPVVHIDIPSNDPKALSAFYHEAFNWNIQIPEGFADYPLFQVDGGPGGGFVRVGDMNGVTIKPGDVLLYIDTNDIDASLAKVQALGGKVLVGKTEIPQIGWYAIFTDPTGNKMGLYTNLPR